MSNTEHSFGSFPTTTLADVLRQSQVMRYDLRPLTVTKRIHGPAFTVRLLPGDNLMLHVAMYEAPPGSIVVVESGDLKYAAIGGNVAKIAHLRGIAGLVLDGVVRDIGEIRDLGFPVYARGCVPIPGTKSQRGYLNEPIVCGDVKVKPADIIVADEDGIIVIPSTEVEVVHHAASLRLAKEQSETFEQWRENHRTRIEDAYYRHVDLSSIASGR